MAAAGAGALPLKATCDSLAEREKALLTYALPIATSINTAADYLSTLGETEKAAGYTDVLASLGQLEHEIKAHQAVLLELGRTHQASTEPTDFKALIDSNLKDHLQQHPYDPRSDPRLRQFKEAMAAEGGGAGPSDGGGGADLGEDEDLMEMGGQRWVNDKCPICIKDVLDLAKPVVDPLGYVFEEQAVREYLRGKPAAGATHPVAGVKQLLRAADLRPATEVERAKRRRALARAMGADGAGGAGGAGGRRGAEEDVVDVE
ncbi:hypothetical protein HYH03_017944 [Edaphochlamys debaryana]|uniref:Uncharacterized protein n=1 Tax=Edaphochlamys debaryana TaxID=47281 RepID=A0A835XEP5_9CHLO|nr:hypothetical protein HYH03_017944 [Edaphochlamys debaryana]|eukprot:KAG2483152.1 hypothetical protein HYH03_017944 [Edaphochlamys debaryana]